MFAFSRRAGIAAIGAIAFAGTLLFSSAGYTQAGGPFSAAAGNWSGGGSVAFNDGRKERIRCRASYAVENGGFATSITISCASDSYKFELTSNITASGNQVAGTWDERSRGVGGNISGTISGGTMNLRAGGQTFNAILSIALRPGSQSITIQSPGSELSAVSISLNKGG